MAGTIRLLAIIEASTITGPAKNLLQFASVAGAAQNGSRVEVSIAVFQRPKQPELFIETARRMSVPVYPIPESGRFDREVTKKLVDLTRELRPDIIQTHAVKSHFLARISGIDKAAPWLAFHHGYTWPDMRARLYNQLDRWSLRRAVRVLTVSRPFREELVRKGVERSRIEVIHNAIDPSWGHGARQPEKASALRARLGIAPDREVVLIVGRLSREKDHVSLVEAIGGLRELKPHLLIVGEGPERPRIESAIRQLGLGDAVTFTGQVASAEPYYGVANVAVLSSLSEGSPNALLEAMAARVPVVSTDVGGVSEIVVNRESALLAQPGDPQSLGASIRELLTDTSLARALTGRAYDAILAHHTPDGRAGRLIGIYNAVLAERAPAT